MDRKEWEQAKRKMMELARDPRTPAIIEYDEAWDEIRVWITDSRVQDLFGDCKWRG